MRRREVILIIFIQIFPYSLAGLYLKMSKVNSPSLPLNLSSATASASTHVYLVTSGPLLQSLAIAHHQILCNTAAPTAQLSHSTHVLPSPQHFSSLHKYSFYTSPKLSQLVRHPTLLHLYSPHYSQNNPAGKNS